METLGSTEASFVQTTNASDSDEIPCPNNLDSLNITAKPHQIKLVGRSHTEPALPKLIVAFKLKDGRFFGSGQITGTHFLSAVIESLTERDGLNLLAGLPEDRRLIGGAAHASYSAASYALELWCLEYIEKIIIGNTSNHILYYMHD